MKTKNKNLLLTAAGFLFVANMAHSQTCGTSQVTYSGYTASYLPKWNATSGCISNSSIFDNGNVGIGTTAPIDKFHIASSGSDMAFVMSRANGNYPFEIFRSESAGTETFRAKLSDNSTWHNYITMGEGNASHAVSNIIMNEQGGNVGIGTAAPDAILDVRSVNYGNPTTTLATTVANSTLKINGGVSGASLFFGLNSSASGYWIQSQRSTGVQDISLNPAGGYVGIGTSTPGALLEVAGQVKITGGTPGAGKILISDANGLASWSTVGANGGWSTTGNASTVDGTNFVGTTDDIPFNIRVNNQKAGRIDRALFNTFFGYQAGNANTTGYINTANGYQALYSNTTGYANTALGHLTLKTNTTGSANVACGDFALELNTTGNYNTATGVNALAVNTTGSYNTAVNQALVLNTTGNYNTGVGFGACGINETGSYNTALGYQAEPIGNNCSNSMQLGAITNDIGGSNSIVLSNPSCSYFWCQVNLTVGSDKRIKDDIKENVPGLAFISKLRPVTYHYNIHRENEILGVKNDHNWDGKYDIEKKTMTGFIAQEVEQSANQIGYDFSGVSKPQNDKSIYGLRYAEFVVPLVKAVQEQQQMIDSLKAETANQNSINKSLQQQIDNLISNNSNHSNSINNSNAINTNIDLNDKNVVVLEQNIPNPFAEQTIINYNLPDNFARAQIIFLDQSGKLIKAVDLTEKGRGILNVFASDLTNGMYTYSLIVDGQTMETKKMMKTK